MMEKINIEQIGLIVLAALNFAQVIARATPTKKDDEIVSKIGKILNFIFLKSRTK